MTENTIEKWEKGINRKFVKKGDMKNGPQMHEQMLKFTHREMQI